MGENMQFIYISKLNDISKRAFYFIPSSEFNACESKVDKSNFVYSEKRSYFFTRDEYDFIFFTQAKRGYFDS